MGIFSKDKAQDININVPDINQQFQDAANRNEVAEVLRELFQEGKIYLITDLTKDEIKLATRIYMIAEMKNIESWKTGLRFFVTLMLSKDRKSRKELLEAMKGQIGKTTFVDRISGVLRK